MKPSAIHTMPALEVKLLANTFYESCVTQSVFGFDPIGAIYFEDGEPGQGVEVHLKAEHCLHGRTQVAVSSLLFGGKPFGVHVDAGEGSQTRFYLTDADVFRQADIWVRSCIRGDTEKKHIDATDTHNEPSVSDLPGYTVLNSARGLRIVPHFAVDADSRLVADPVAWREAVFKEAAPAVRALGEGYTMRDEEVRAIAMRVFMNTRVEELDCAEVDDYDDQGNWIAYVVATKEGAYKVGVPASELDTANGWMKDMGVGRAGGPEEIEKYRSTFDLYSPATPR